VARQGIANAIEQIARERETYFISQLGRLRLETSIRTIDGLLEDLELKNLSGCKTVPDSWQPKLDRLLSALPVEPPSPLKATGSTVRLMDELFQLQGMLLRMKASRSAEMERADAAIEEELAAQLSPGAPRPLLG